MNHAGRDHKCPECGKVYACGGCEAEDGNNEIYCGPCEWELYGPKE
jgi:hypothetical protein